MSSQYLEALKRMEEWGSRPVEKKQQQPVAGTKPAVAVEETRPVTEAAEPKKGRYAGLDERLGGWLPFGAPVASISPAPERSAVERVLRGLGVAGEGLVKGATLGLGQRGGPIERGIARLFDIEPPQPLQPETAGERLAAGAGELLGSLAPVGALYGTVGKAAAGLIPETATGVAARLGRAAVPGAVSGAVYGGARAAVEGESPQGVARQAAIDAALFGGGDVAVRALGRAAVSAWRKMRGLPEDVPVPGVAPALEPDFTVDPWGNVYIGTPKQGLPRGKTPGELPPGDVPALLPEARRFTPDFTATPEGIEIGVPKPRLASPRVAGALQPGPEEQLDVFMHSPQFKQLVDNVIEKRTQVLSKVLETMKPEVQRVTSQLGRPLERGELLQIVRDIGKSRGIDIDKLFDKAAMSREQVADELALAYKSGARELPLFGRDVEIPPIKTKTGTVIQTQQVINIEPQKLLPAPAQGPAKTRIPKEFDITPVPDRGVLQKYEMQYNTKEEIKKQLSKYYSGVNKEGLDEAAGAIQDLRNSEIRAKAVRKGRGHGTGQGQPGRISSKPYRTVGLSFSRDLIDTGKINLVGVKFNDVHDLAVISQVFRDPRFETLRIYYTKGNQIVGMEDAGV